LFVGVMLDDGWWSPAREGGSGTLEIQTPQIGPELVRQVGARKCELHGRLEESELLPSVVSPAPELDSADGSAPPQGAKAVGKLDLPAPGIRRRVGQNREEARLKRVPSSAA
jgi:hypothetical protein